MSWTEIRLRSGVIMLQSNEQRWEEHRYSNGNGPVMMLVTEPLVYRVVPRRCAVHDAYCHWEVNRGDGRRMYGWLTCDTEWLALEEARRSIQWALARSMQYALSPTAAGMEW